MFVVVGPRRREPASDYRYRLAARPGGGRVSLTWAQTAEQYALWDALVMSHPAGSAYHLSWYLEHQRLPRCTVEIVLAEQDARAVAGAVVYTFRLPAGIVVSLVPSGPIARAAHEKQLPDVVKAIVQRAAAAGAMLVQFEAFEAETRDVIRDEFPPHRRFDHPVWKLYHPSLWRELRVDLRGKTAETLLASFTTTTRQRIREAMKLDADVFEIRDDSALDEIHALWEHGGRELGYVIRPLTSFRALVKESWRRDAGILVATRHEGHLAAFVYAIFHANGAMYMYGAHDRQFSQRYSTRILQYRAMCAAVERGVPYYSLGGPADGGIREYKMSFRPHMVDNWRFVGVVLRPMQLRLLRGLIGNTKWMNRAKSWATRWMK